VQTCAPPFTIDARGGFYGAGIGGGGSGCGGCGAGGVITITGGTVIALGNTSGAGIGGGGNDTPAVGGAGGEITISGGTVIALGNGRGAGIGGGGNDDAFGMPGGDSGNIAITGGTVYARSSSSPAHIGYGVGGGGNGADANFTYTGGSVKPVIFAGTISEGSPNYAGSDGIAGVGDVTVAMTTDTVNVGGINVTTVDTVTVTLQPGRSFTVPANATLTVPPIAELNLNGQTFTNNGTVIKQGAGVISNTGGWSGPTWQSAP
jgi:hypothetical protein